MSTTGAVDSELCFVAVATAECPSQRMLARQDSVRRLTLASRADILELDAAPSLCVRIAESSTSLVHNASCDFALSRECCFRGHSSSSSQRIVAMRHGHKLIELYTSVVRMPCSKTTASHCGVPGTAAEACCRQQDSAAEGPAETVLTPIPRSGVEGTLAAIHRSVNQLRRAAEPAARHACTTSFLGGVQLTKLEAHRLS